MAKKLSLFTAVLALSVQPALAAPVFWTENGHYYEAVPREGNWQQSSDLALRSLGYLVTVGDAAENIFAFDIHHGSANYGRSAIRNLNFDFGLLRTDGRRTAG